MPACRTAGVPDALGHAELAHAVIDCATSACGYVVVFTLLVRAIGTRAPRSLRILLATVGAFLFLGVFHDACWLVYDRPVVIGTSGLWIWRPLDELMESSEPRKRMVARGVSRLGFACSLCLSFWIFL